MLILRREQIQAFEDFLLKQFEDRTLAHLREFFPDQCNALDEPQLREGIRSGIRRAEGYGFSSKRDLCKYLNLMFTFGRVFDTDPELPWAAKILNLQGLPSKKMDFFSDLQHLGMPAW